MPVMGSSDSKTVRCRAPRSWMRSPRTTVTAPLAKPTASWDRSSKAANADIGNCLRPLCTESVLWHRGMPVFFSSLSNAHTFRTGSLDRSSAIVTSSAVPWTCFIWVIAPVSCALNERTTLKACETMRTTPSALPKKMLSEPETADVMFPGYGG